jgi:hypothetical protein
MFLACKVEEVSKSLETCIREFWDQRYRSRIGRTDDELRKAREKVSDPVCFSTLLYLVPGPWCQVCTLVPGL